MAEKLDDIQTTVCPDDKVSNIPRNQAFDKPMRELDTARTAVGLIPFCSHSPKVDSSLVCYDACWSSSTRFQVKPTKYVMQRR